MSVLARLRGFAGSSRGRLVLGGGAAVGVTGLALARRRSTASPEAAPAAPPFATAPPIPAASTSGYPDLTLGGVDPGAWEDRVAAGGSIADNSVYEQAVRDAFQAYSPTQPLVETQDPKKFAKWVALAKVEGIGAAQEQIRTRSALAAAKIKK